MNTAADVKLEEEGEDSFPDRRRGMKLVICNKQSTYKKRFDIKVSSEMFSREPGKGGCSEAKGRDIAKKSDDQVSDAPARTTRTPQTPDDSTINLRLVAAGVLGVGLLGYLIGRMLHRDN